MLYLAIKDMTKTKFALKTCRVMFLRDEVKYKSIVSNIMTFGYLGQLRGIRSQITIVTW